MYVCNELISETDPTIFLKLGMKLGDNKGKKVVIEPAKATGSIISPFYGWMDVCMYVTN